MRIMHISNNYTPYSGGVVSSLNALLPSLQKAGHDIMLITLDFLNQKNSNDSAWVCRIPSLFNVMYHNNPLAFPTNAYNFIKEKVDSFKPDIIHIHHPFLLGVIGKEIAQKYSIPCIFTYHTMYEKYAHYIPLPQAIAAPIIQKIVLSFCKDVAAIITPSKGIKQYLEDHAILTPLHVLASPLQDHFFNSTVPQKSKSTFELLTVGRFMPEKNIALLIDLYAQLNPKDYRLSLVGYGAQEAQLRSLAYDYYHYCEQQIRFIIKPDPTTLRKAYHDADLFLFSSQTDTQGLVLAESMINGTPVLALPGLGQQDIIEQGVNGFIINSQEEMINLIHKLRGDQSLLKKLSENAYTTAQRFKADTITNGLIALYKNYL